MNEGKHARVIRFLEKLRNYRPGETMEVAQLVFNDDLMDRSIVAAIIALEADYSRHRAELRNVQGGQANDQRQDVDAKTFANLTKVKR